MKVTRILGPNQQFAICPDCQKETLFQKSGERWFCILWNSHGKAKPPDPPAKIVEPQRESPILTERETGIVEIDRIGFKSRAIDRVPNPESYQAKPEPEEPDKPLPGLERMRTEAGLKSTKILPDRETE